MTTKSFGDCIAEEGHEPTADAFIYTHAMLETSWALARDIFGDQARPEHAFEICDRVNACTSIGDEDSDEEDDDETQCDHCGHKAACHPTVHEADGTCYLFVPLDEGCDNCSQHKDAHGHDAWSNDVCASYCKVEPS